MNDTILLHTCCAPCSAAIIEWLLNNNVKPILFFYNPNIFPLEEYERRKNELKRYAISLDIEFIDGDYNHNYWLEQIQGLEAEPERGSRCLECFKIRLLATAKLASLRGITRITTTLASSRWKSLEQISTAGNMATQHFANVEFWDKNWKKGGLSERRQILLNEFKFYNQTYCGCEFSIRK
ncbi:putative adenine nucleotide alpha hydrolase (AANH) superfamily ATPase [Dysgonomonadaceae bacterium PH5-43]|nr:putative adenine nucleotide alpha hydrolase (AANH) superfamily ATPase [Dysgonomonadaceae bacterium PH5-43]